MPKVECPKCLGCGRLDSKEGKPWCEINREPNLEVRKGFITPVECPECNGFGNVDAPAPEKPEVVKPSKPAPEAQPSEVSKPN